MNLRYVAVCALDPLLSNRMASHSWVGSTPKIPVEKTKRNETMLLGTYSSSISSIWEAPSLTSSFGKKLSLRPLS